MKQGLRMKLQKISLYKIAIGLYIVGVFAGILVANCFQGSYKEQMTLLENGTFQSIGTSELLSYNLFIYTIGQRLKEFFIFWLLCITILGLPYMVYKIVHAGYLTGFFISIMIIQYGLKGFILCFAYVFPQYLIYIPVAIFTLKKGYRLCVEMNQSYAVDMKSKIRLMINQLGLIFLLLVAIVVGCFLESYIGASILKKAIMFVIK